MGWQARLTGADQDRRRSNENDAQLHQGAPRSHPRAGHRQPVSRVLVQTEFPTPREHAGKKSVRRVARLWVRP